MSIAMSDPAPAPALELDRFLPYLVNVLASRLSRELAAVYEARFGVSIPEWRLIAHLSQNRNISVREIHERVDMDKAKISRAAARLEALGFVEKEINEGDRRLVALRLTRKGRNLFAEIEPLALAYERASLAALSQAEQAALRVTVAKLLAAPPEQSNLRPARRRAGN
jgi:DNA-binding MarR family transcriptional regulator